RRHRGVAGRDRRCGQPARRAARRGRCRHGYGDPRGHGRGTARPGHRHPRLPTEGEPMRDDLPPELRDDGIGHRRVQPLWWRVTSAVIALLLIGMLVVAYTL